MLPGERELVKAMKDKPFVLLGINSDSGRSGLKKKFEKNHVTWPNIIEGRPGEKAALTISGQWNIHVYPTLFLIDHEGRIIERGHLSEWQLKDMVKKQIAKIPKS